MTQFQGFPSGGRVEYTSIPDVFFSGLLPQITDMAELKVTLYVISMLYHKKGYPRFVSYRDLLGNVSLMQSLKGSEEMLRDALKVATGRGTLLTLTVEKDGVTEVIYFLNDGNGRQAVTKIQSGTLELAGLKAVMAEPVKTEELPDIFTLYEQNIGMLTPMIADELRDAERLYPPDWIRDAIKEAVSYNKRNIKYIVTILQRWSLEGRSYGTHRRHIKEADSHKFVKGKYGRMVQH
jgi:DNA replication protein